MSDRLDKLLRLALDKGTTHGEATNAFEAARRLIVAGETPSLEASKKTLETSKKKVDRYTLTLTMPTSYLAEYNRFAYEYADKLDVSIKFTIFHEESIFSTKVVLFIAGTDEQCKEFIKLMDSVLSAMNKDILKKNTEILLAKHNAKSGQKKKEPDTKNGCKSKLRNAFKL